jgi:hypothetical protein
MNHQHVSTRVLLNEARESGRRTLQTLKAGITTLLSLVMLFFTAGIATAADIVRVEEDWKVEVGTPDVDTEAPQIVTVIGPQNSTDGLYAVFEMNHNTLPDYQAGGLQLQAWQGEANLDFHSFPDQSRMNNSNEVVTFTMSMNLNAGNLVFEVVNGDSTTWGHFGGQGYLKSTVATELDNLNSYAATMSIANSRVGYASHRVKKFVRTAVRTYSAQGLISEDKTEQVVHQYTEGN